MELIIFIPTVSFAILLSAFLGCYSVITAFKQQRRHPDSQSVAEAAVDIEAADKPATVTVEDGDAHMPTLLKWDIPGVAVSVGPKRSKVILHATSGVAVSGDLIGILGPSGAGKSTFLDALAMRNTGTRAACSIVVDGVALQKDIYQGLMAYVPQEDIFIPTLSVEETLQTAVDLRFGRRLQGPRKKALLQHWLEALGLQKVAGTRVGGILPGGLMVRGLSGGERRRLSIACGVVGAPWIICLDEPTSGLDARSAVVLMECMAKLATQSHIVIATVHQPRLFIWNLFQKAMLLSEGRVLYYGLATQVLPWFRDRLGYAYEPAKHGAVSDWLIDLVSHSGNKDAGSTAQHHMSLKEIDAAAEAFSKSQGEDVSTHGKQESIAVDAMPGKSKRSSRTSFCNQVNVLLKRCLVSYSRNPANATGRVLMATVLGIVSGVAFVNIGTGTGSDLQQLSSLFFVTFVLGLLPFVYMTMFMADRQFFSADPAGGMYHPLAYYAATAISHTLVTISNGVVVTLIVYSLEGLLFTPRAVLLTTLAFTAHTLIAVQLLVMCSYMTPNQDLAFVVAVGYTAICTLVSGFFGSVGKMAPFWRGLSLVTFFRYTINIIAPLQFENGCGQGLDTLKGRACQAILDENDFDLGVANSFAGLAGMLVALHCGSILFMLLFGRK